jgi:hypothetical protein
MTTYIRDLIELPDRVRRGDFVLRLSEGVTKPEETIDNYVVTPQLVDSFDEALGLIRSAIESNSSKGSYLHGSFGSGKSHFMAVLHLLLQNNPRARSIPELATVVARHNSWTTGKRFLLVPYHMIGATDMESAILGGYADHIRRIHPEAPTPGVYRSDEIFSDAENLRQSMGDDGFFKKLNGDSTNRGGQSSWGNIAAGWDATSFDVAVNASPKSEDRVRLVGDLVEKFFTAARSSKEFVDLDTGLSIISRHARALGYDALIMFLDELILWLASHAADVSFVNREGQKLAKLVESQTADRPAPIISFVARQRDLKELVGDQITGAELLSFSDILKWWEARFHKIILEDRNLPAIAERRVLKPKSESARQMMDDAFKDTASIREDVMKVLLTSHANRELFRKIYPFSPALVETLVAVSFLLQRERTALKVMQQLLVEQKDRLKLGDIVPVGDLFDAIAEGDEAFSDVMKVHFENAKKLYQQKLRPILERDHGLSFDELKSLPPENPKAVNLRNDDRLVKTLLISALAPNVESLKALTASRLAALNHGTIKSPVEGRETQMVIQKCRKWAAEVGQIKIGDETNPTVAVQLTGVDTESIIVQAQAEDNQGNRIRKVKDLLFQQLGIRQEDKLSLHHEFVWRATKRSCEIVFTNIRDLTDNSLTTIGDEWKVIIDYPFDTEGHGPRDDIARVERYLRENEQSTRTIAWVPSFLSLQALKELGVLIILDHILTGERFSSYVTHLSPVDQTAAKSLLENQQSQLRHRMIAYLEGAYGITPPVSGSLNETNPLSQADHFQSLDQGFMLQPAVGANLGEGFEHLLDQALRHQFPAHPQFERETKLNNPALKRVYEAATRVTQALDGRLSVEQPQRKELRQIANPLRLGEMHETHFLLAQHWQTHFLKKEAEDGGPVTVGKLRKWIDQPLTMGLPREVQNLIMLVVAAQTNRSFFLHGGPFNASVDNLTDDLELREQALPSKSDWEVATKRAASIFGVTSSPLVSAANVASFIAAVKTRVPDAKTSCDSLCERLQQMLPSLLSEGLSTPRYRTAVAAKALVDAIKQSSDSQIIPALVSAEVASSESAMGTSVNKAAVVVDALTQVNWDLLEAVKNLKGERAQAGNAIWKTLRESFQKDEYAISISAVLKELQTRATRLLVEASAPPATPPTVTLVTPPSSPPASTGQIVLSHGSRSDLSAEDFSAVVDDIQRALDSERDASLRISWEIYKK